MNQRKPDVPPRELVPYDPTRMIKAEPVYGEYYYGYAHSKSAQAKSYLQLLRRQRGLMIGVFLGVLIVGLGWLVTRTPLYRSSAEVLVTPIERGGSGNSESIAINIEVMMRVRTVATQIKMMKSPDLLEAAFANVPPDLRLKGFHTKDSRLSDYPVTITNPKDTEIVGIEVLAQDPKAAAAFANEILASAMNRRQENIHAIAEMATEHVSSELTQTGSDLQKARAELARLKRDHGIPNIDEATRSDAASLANLESAVTQAQVDLSAGQKRRETLARELSHTAKIEVSSIETTENPTTRAIDDQIERLEQEKAAALLEYQPTAPEVRNIERQIAELKRRQSDMVMTIIARKSQNTNPLYINLMNEYANSLVAIREAESRLAVSSSAAQVMRGRLSQLPELEEKVAVLVSRIGELENSHSFLNGQLQALRLSMRGSLPNVVPIAHARASRFPVSPNIPVSLMMIFAFAALASVGAAVLRDQLDDRIHTSDSLEGSAGYRVLAAIPLVQNGFQGLVTDENSPSRLLENFRIMRNNIFLTAQGPHPQVIVITSPRAGEGKSTTVANLAVTTAMSHKRVLVIDGDLRHPSIHLTFGMANNVGLSSVLQDEAPLDECIRQASLPNLHVLTAGPTPAFPPELLASPAMTDLLAAVRGQYDTIFLDSTPVVNLSDGAQLASLAEGAIMVVSAARTERASLLEALRILEQVGVPILGIVYNRSSDMETAEWTETAPKAIQFQSDSE
jgi:capsular exopolysaccharide synthesis family protein